MRRLFRSAVVLAVVLAAPRLTDACSCVAASPCQQYGRANAVFAGEIVDVTAAPETGPPRAKIARLRVARAFKGAVEVGQVVTIEMPAGSSASCSLDVEPGARFVIYAGAEGGRFRTNLCAGSYGLPAGVPWPDVPPTPGVVSGRLVRYPNDSSRQVEPVVGVVVSMGPADRRITTKTDADGKFRLEKVAAGTWPVAFAVGAGEQAEATVDMQSADDCAELFVPVRPRQR